jgi:hypothetical protein
MADPSACVPVLITKLLVCFSLNLVPSCCTKRCLAGLNYREGSFSDSSSLLRSISECLPASSKFLKRCGRNSTDRTLTLRHRADARFVKIGAVEFILDSRGRSR